MSKLNLILTSVVLAFTGAVLLFAIPGSAGPFRGGRLSGVISHEREFLSIARDTWINLHSLGALVLVAVILFHVVLHWRGSGGRRDGSPRVTGNRPNLYSNPTFCSNSLHILRVN